MKALNIVWQFVDRAIWMVGLFSIFDFTRDRWPRDYLLLPWAVIAFAVGLFVWRYFYIPFRAGLRGEEPGELRPPNT